MYGDRRVYTVLAFNQGVGSWIARLPTVWVEGEVTELRRRESWQTVYFTLKDPQEGASVSVTMPRAGFDGLRLDLADGLLVQVMGRPELWSQRGTFQLRALTIETVGEGGVLVRLEQLRRRLAAEGLFADERKRPLPFLPQTIALVTGRDAAAKHDVIATITGRFPPATILVVETAVQGPRAPLDIVEALSAACAAGADVIVLARGGGSFEDLLPFSDERLVQSRCCLSSSGRVCDRPRAGHASLRSRCRCARLDADRRRPARGSGLERARHRSRGAAGPTSPLLASASRTGARRAGP